MKNHTNGSEINLPFGLKEKLKRTIQLVNIAIFIATVLIPIRLIYGHYLAAASLSIFCIFCGLILWLNKKTTFRYNQAIIIVGFNTYLVLLSVIDGLNSGDYLYFFPLFFVLPFLVELQGKFLKTTITYFSLTAFSLVACFVFGQANSAWQSISKEVYSQIFILNVIGATLLSVAFAFMNIYFERMYVKALLAEKNKTEEALKSRSQFLSHMGHELRTPLNGIIGATNLLIKFKTQPEQEEYIDILKYCSHHMLDLINNFLDYNKIEAEKFQVYLKEVNLKQVLNHSLLPVHDKFGEKNLELKLNIDDKLNEIVFADDIRLIQIINNLVSNALNGTENGLVQLNTSCLQKTSDRMEVLFSVESTSVGFQKDLHKKSFENSEVDPENSRQRQGTDLGLNLSQQLISLMDSELKVSCEPGVGRRYAFTITFKRGGQNNKPRVASKVDGDLKGLRILIAEDNMINMLIATKMLEDWKVNFTTAENGKQALESLRRDANYDLILMDLEMPEMDGYTAVKEITKLYPEVPVMAFTANLVDNQMFNNLKQLGFVDAMLKPFQPMELFSKIRYYAN